MNVSFTAVLGVWGRPVFKNMLDSLQRNMGPDDQVIAVVDSFEQGERPDVQELVQSYGPQFECYAYNAGYHFLGAEQMNFAFRSVPMRGSHVIALADDDVLVDGALKTYREFCQMDMERPLQPRFVPPWHTELLWDFPRMQRARITSAIVVPQQFVCPWPTALDVCSDYDWMVKILAQSPPPIWLDYVSIIAKPEVFGDDVLHQGVWQCDVCHAWGYREKILDDQCACGATVRYQARMVDGV